MQKVEKSRLLRIHFEYPSSSQNFKEKINLAKKKKEE